MRGNHRFVTVVGAMDPGSPSSFGPVNIVQYAQALPTGTDPAKLLGVAAALYALQATGAPDTGIAIRGVSLFSNDPIKADLLPAVCTASVEHIFNETANRLNLARTLDLSGNIAVTLVDEGIAGTVALQAAFNTENQVFQRWSNNDRSTVLASAARTTTTTSANQTNNNWRGLHLPVNVTAVPGGDTITPEIQAQDPVSGTFYPVLVGPAIAATGMTVLKVYPGITPVANGAASDILPRVWRVVVTHSGAGSFTYSVGANLIV